MKKVYIVTRGDMIYIVSSNIKAAYDCLVSHRSEMDGIFLHSYMHITRLLKKKDVYYVPSNSGPKWEIKRFPLVSNFTH